MRTAFAFTAASAVALVYAAISGRTLVFFIVAGVALVFAVVMAVRTPGPAGPRHARSGNPVIDDPRDETDPDGEGFIAEIRDPAPVVPAIDVNARFAAALRESRLSTVNIVAAGDRPEPPPSLPPLPASGELEPVPVIPAEETIKIPHAVGTWNGTIPEVLDRLEEEARQAPEPAEAEHAADEEPAAEDEVAA